MDRRVRHPAQVLIAAQAARSLPTGVLGIAATTTSLGGGPCGPGRPFSSSARAVLMGGLLVRTPSRADEIRIAQASGPPAAELVARGRALFSYLALSADSRWSCASCHPGSQGHTRTTRPTWEGSPWWPTASRLGRSTPTLWGAGFLVGVLLGRVRPPAWRGTSWGYRQPDEGRRAVAGDPGGAGGLRAVAGVPSRISNLRD